MDKETKDKLREYSRKKRAKTRLLKDVPPEELAIACDWVKENGKAVEDVERMVGRQVAYLSRASAAQLQVLRANLPSANVQFGGWTGFREVYLKVSLLAALRFLGVDKPEKYVKVARGKFAMSWIFKDSCTGTNDWE